MGIASVVLVLTSAVLHALWNRRLHRSSDKVVVIGISYLVGGLVLLPWLDAEIVDVGFWLLLSVGLHAGYQLLLTSSYGRGALSVTYPIARGLSPALVAVGGWVLLDQRPNATTLVGVALVSAGLLVLAAVGRRSAELAAVGLAALTGLVVTGYTLTDARAVQDVGPTGYLALVGVGAGLVVLLVERPRGARLRAAFRSGGIVGVMQIGSYLLVLFALQQAQAAQVVSLRQLSVFIGVVIAGEAVGRQAYVAAACVAAGAVLIAW